MRSGTRSLSVLFLLLGASCSQIIGLGDYDKTDGDELTGGKGSAGDSNGGSNAGGSGGTNRGGNATGAAGSGVGGGSSDAGAGGENEGGGPTTGGGTGKGGSGGSATGGVIGTGGVNGTGGVEGGAGGAGNGGDGGDGGTTGTGGSTTGGVGPTLGGSGGLIGTGGVAGKGGAPPTSGGAAGKGGAPPTSGGAPTSGGTAGKGGSGGTSGGTAGKGGSGGTGGTPCTTQQLLGNPNFDAATVAPWLQLTTESYTMILTTANIPAVTGYPVTPLSGTRAAVLGGVSTVVDDYADSWVYQDITIPPRTTQLTFACYRQIRTTEAPSGDYDLLFGSLFDVNSDEVLRFFEWSNVDVVSNWTAVSTTADASPFAGKTYQMQFNANYDDSLQTWFYIDNCSVLATVCQ